MKKLSSDGDEEKSEKLCNKKVKTSLDKNSELTM